MYDASGDLKKFLKGILFVTGTAQVCFLLSFASIMYVCVDGRGLTCGGD